MGPGLHAGRGLDHPGPVRRCVVPQDPQAHRRQSPRWTGRLPPRGGEGRSASTWLYRSGNRGRRPAHRYHLRRDGPGGGRGRGRAGRTHGGHRGSAHRARGVASRHGRGHRDVWGPGLRDRSHQQCDETLRAGWLDVQAVCVDRRGRAGHRSGLDVGRQLAAGFQWLRGAQLRRQLLWRGGFAHRHRRVRQHGVCRCRGPGRRRCCRGRGLPAGLADGHPGTVTRRPRPHLCPGYGVPVRHQHGVVLRDPRGAWTADAVDDGQAGVGNEWRSAI